MHRPRSSEDASLRLSAGVDFAGGPEDRAFYIQVGGGVELSGRRGAAVDLLMSRIAKTIPPGERSIAQRPGDATPVTSRGRATWNLQLQR